MSGTVEDPWNDGEAQVTMVDAARPRPLPGWAALGAAVGAGAALLLAFPMAGLWWLAPVGVALLAAAVHRRGAWAGAGLGALAGLTCFVPLLSWTNLHTGAVPWLLLSGLQAAYLALLGAAGALASALVDRRRWAWPLVTALLWVAQEALRDRTPFGGFPWGRLAFSQGDSPLLRLAAYGGAPLVTFGVALAGGLLAAALWRPWRGPGRSGQGRALALLGGAAALVSGALLLPVGAPAGAPVTVAVVQGNVPRMGLDFNEQRRAVLDNHVDATIALAGRVAAGQVRRPDLVVWPENSSDIDPLRNLDARARIDEAAAAISAPILVGAVLRGPGENQVRNAGLIWNPGSGPDLDQMYVKRHPVPFAEYVPMRRIARMVSAEVDRVRSEFVAGAAPGVMRAGPAVLGDVICFEVAYDEVVRDTVTGGAGLLVVQTNNATFNPAEAHQQLAMVRLRAVEHGRDSLMASTVGVSGFVGADGRVHDATGFNVQAVVVRELNSGATRTLATKLGFWPEVVLVALAAIALLAAVAARRRSRGGPVRVTAEQEARVSDADTPVGSSAEGYPGVGRVLVVIPTFNEADNVRVITDRVRQAVPTVDVLVADDNSPDGTGAIADELAAADERIKVLHRTGKQGLGAAYVHGFGWAREQGYDAVVQMDADGSHAPEQLPELLDAAARGADVVIGSRWVRGGRVVNWPAHRLLLSRCGNLYTRIALGMPVRDATGGYRVYRIAVLDKIDVESVSSQGYSFQVELSWRAHRQGLAIVEVPITFAERERGTSKMSSSIVREALWRVTVWGARARRDALLRAFRRRD